MFCIANYDIYWVYREDGHKEEHYGTAVLTEKGIPYICVELPPLLSLKAICIPIGNTTIVLEAIYKS
jgi:hypothetical protein